MIGRMTRAFAADDAVRSRLMFRKLRFLMIDYNIYGRESIKRPSRGAMAHQPAALRQAGKLIPGLTGQELAKVRRLAPDYSPVFFHKLQHHLFLP
jgi:hypothetical protein